MHTLFLDIMYLWWYVGGEEMIHLAIVEDEEIYVEQLNV